MTDTAVQKPIDPESDGAIPLADTLDEATLRRVFPDAPASLDVPRDVRSLFAARMRTFGGQRRTVWLACVLGLLAAAAFLVGLGHPVPGAIIAGLALVAVIGVSIWQYSKATDEFFERYATARGLHHHEDSHVPADVPLFGKGDKRRWPHVLTGTIAGHAARLGHYTYTDVSTDSDGNREETDYDFTVLAFTLPRQVAERFAGVYCAPKGISLGRLQDKLAHDRAVQLESIEFHKRYSLRCVDDQDDIALYELFSTTFVQRLATELEVYWEQRGDDLVFWKKGHETEAADLDRFCLDSWHVLHRYLEEWR